MAQLFRGESQEEDQARAALDAYGRYLADECGVIQFEGLPADGEVGTRKLRLENVFVPLHLELPGRERETRRLPVGAVLAEHPRLALLAAPGGGKSTLLKRLAVAYANPARRTEAADGLPDRDWLPLFFRCRELRGQARASFAELLDALERREHVRPHAAAFRVAVDQALLEGRALLLVDGLDEIADPGDRAAFVCTLRSALQAHPATALVVTSREAGFRHVAAHLSAICTHASISPFDDKDIRRLTLAWHKEVAGESEKVEADAGQLANAILANDRIKRLAVNPLLLTTLFLVKRWVGSLPTRRAALYGKAVEVLLMTWNVEAYDPIPDEEALPQLCYVASAMMMDGVQKISRPQLAGLLKEAREALPAELGYVKTTVEEFIRRVEDRSSLLMMTGHDVEDGQLVEFFEFRHLTFQEYLTAKAMVQGWHSGREDADALTTVLEPYFLAASWQEVIPLAAVLGGKATERLIRRLTELIGAEESPESERDSYPVPMPSTYARTLFRCLLDEAAAKPDAVRSALRVMRWSEVRDLISEPGVINQLATGRYALEFDEEIGGAFLKTANWALALALHELVTAAWFADEAWLDPADHAGRVASMLTAPDRLSRCKAAFAAEVLFRSSRSAAPDDLPVHEFLTVADGLALMLEQPHHSEQLAAIVALESLWSGPLYASYDPPPVLARLARIWINCSSPSLSRSVASAFAVFPVSPGRRFAALREISDRDFRRCIEQFLAAEGPGLIDEAAVILLCWYLRVPWDDSELRRRTEDLFSRTYPEYLLHGVRRNLYQLLRSLGETRSLDELTRAQLGIVPSQPTNGVE